MIHTLCRLVQRNVPKFEFIQHMRYSSRVMKVIRQPVKTTCSPSADNAFTLMDILKRQNAGNFTILPLKSEHHEAAVGIIKKYYLPEHVLVRTRNVDLSEDQAITEYLNTLLKQGNSLYATSEDGRVAGVCINFAACAVDPVNLRNYAFHRQDPDSKDFLYLIAKLQETPNFWTIFKQVKVFEVKMLTVIPEFRRQGLAGMLTERSIHQAEDQGYKLIRMDCINDYDYKIAERCMLRCYLQYPLHRLRSGTAPFVKRSSTHDKYVRVYVHASQIDLPHVHDMRADLENMIG